MTEGGESAANLSRQMMQFSLAADRLVGESFSKEVEARLATGHQPGNIPPGSMLQGGIAPNTLLQGGIAPNTLLQGGAAPNTMLQGGSAPNTML